MQIRSDILRDVSICIPIGRSAQWVSQILSHLARKAFPGTILLACYKNRITEDVLRLIAEFQRQRLDLHIVEGMHRHASALRNAAIQQVMTPWCLFLDDDVSLDEEYMSVLEHCLLHANHHSTIIQGCPFQCANPHSWLARCESELYEIRLTGYLSPDKTNIKHCDPRNLLISTAIIKTFGFNEGLVSGEGYELGGRLCATGMIMTYESHLIVYHFNRNTLRDLIKQKFYHGRGRIQIDRLGENLRKRVFAYTVYIFWRHFLGPLRFIFSKRMSPSLVVYTVFTSAIFCCGLLWECIFPSQVCDPRKRLVQ